MKRYGLWLLACLLMGLVACSDDKGKDSPAQTPFVTVEGASTQLLFETVGGSQSVHFSTNVAWTAETDQDWCRVSPDSGPAGDASVTVTVEENEKSDERNATLVLTAGTAVKRLTLVQKQKDALTVTSNKVEVGAEGGEIGLEVRANVAFDYVLDEDAAVWITPVETKALTATHLQFQVQPNEGVEKREGKIVLQADELTETVTVYQAAGAPAIVLTQNEYTIGSDGGEIVIELQSNVEHEMILSQEVDWLSEVPTRAFSTYTHRIQVAPNEGYDLREAEIRFVNVQQEIEEVVRIVQVQKDAILVARSSYEVEAEGGRLDFVVQSNVDFEVLLSADWIQEAPSTRALEEVPLGFTVAANPEREPREATITLKAGHVEQSVTVLQAAYLEENQVSIVISGETFAVPLITGEYFMSAYIWWGDRPEAEEYREGAVHTYDDAGPHTVVIKSTGAERITFTDIVGVSEIDLTEF